MYMDKNKLSIENAAYWNELCGTNTAREIGLDDQSFDSISKFDVWFFDFYPYLLPFIDSSVNGSEEVLEVGLGYGSVASYLAKAGYSYTGLDIAAGPVAMCSRRLSDLEVKGESIIGDALDAPFENNRFDAVIAIGSLHHTGDFQQAIAEMNRICRPGGVICGMVYSIFSARNFVFRPLATLKMSIQNISAAVHVRADEKLRWMSDHNQNGEAAPATEYFSRKALRKILSTYGEVEIKCQNLDTLPLPFGLGKRVRQIMIRTFIARWLGLDLYFSVKTSEEVTLQ